MSFHLQNGVRCGSVRKGHGESTAVPNRSDDGIFVKLERYDTLLPFRECCLRLFGKLTELIDARGKSGESVARVVLESNVGRKQSKHALDVKRVISSDESVDQFSA